MVSTTGEHGRTELQIADGVAEVRLTHDERRNCLSQPMFEDLYDAFSTISENLADVTAVLLAHEGSVFSSGLDMDVMGNPDREEEADRIDELYDACFAWVRFVDRPIVVAARGPAVASGGGFLLRSDVNVVGPDFSIWFPEIDVDVISLAQGARFIKYFGHHRAAGITFLGEEERLTAEEAREVGLVNRIEEPADVEPTARHLAERMAAHQERSGILLDAYEIYNLAKHEHLSFGSGANAAFQSRTTYEEEFGA